MKNEGSARTAEGRAAKPRGSSAADRATDPFRDRVLELVRVPAGTLLPNPKRWRTHPEAQRKALREILERVGIAGGLIARRTEEGLVLVDGHLRQDLASDAIVPVLVVDLDPEEGDLVLATFDPVGEMARAAHEALAALVRSTQVPKELLEWTQGRYPAGAPKHGRTDPDQVPDAPRRPRVRTGEVWALRDHRVGCGDATDPAAIRRLVGEGEVDIVFTDPPYGVDYVGKTAEALTISNDGHEGLATLLERSFAAIDHVLAPGARIYVCHPAGPASATFADAFRRAGWRWHQTLVWVKDRMVLGHADYHYRHEPILYGYKPGPGRWGRGHRGWYGGNDADSVLEVVRPAASREHPTAKPVELIRRCLENSSGVGEFVLDPFGGSGSTLIAAEQLDRRCFLLELEPRYADVAIRRWEEFTGSEAVRVDE